MTQTAGSQSRRLRLSLAACALFMAASTGDPSVSMAGGAVAAIAGAGAGKLMECGALRKVEAYCVRSWRNAGVGPQDWSDCTQDVLIRVLERAGRDGLVIAILDPDSDERRELNRAIWATAQRWRRAVRPAAIGEQNTPVATEDPWPARMGDFERVRQAVDSGAVPLSSTQREILRRWAAGASIAAIADALNLTRARVSDEKYKAVRKLRDHLTAQV